MGRHLGYVQFGLFYIAFVNNVVTLSNVTMAHAKQPINSGRPGTAFRIAIT